jgi:hypothetical protein
MEVVSFVIQLAKMALIKQLASAETLETASHISSRKIAWVVTFAPLFARLRIASPWFAQTMEPSTKLGKNAAMRTTSLLHSTTRKQVVVVTGFRNL